MLYLIVNPKLVYNTSCLYILKRLCRNFVYLYSLFLILLALVTPFSLNILEQKLMKGADKMTGEEVRKMIKSKRVHIWEVAKILQINDAVFSRRLRYDFTDEEVEEVKKAIEKVLNSEN